MSFQQLLREQQRLAILQVLSEAKGYDLNSGIIQTSLNAVALNASRDQVHTEMSWLADQGLIEVEIVGTVYVGRLSVRGIDVAKGLAQVPGVALPEPGA
jgi:hypothetical protein